MTGKATVGILGAGTVGSWLGGQLAAAGHAVTFVGRGPRGEELRRHGLRLSGLPVDPIVVEPEEIRWSEDAAALADAEIVLVTVKARATKGAAEDLAPVLSPEATVVSVQNGIRNQGLLEQELGPRTILAGVLYCNLSRPGEGRIHRGTQGGLALPEETPDQLVVSLMTSGLDVRRHSEIDPLLRGKLLLNLNNGLNALAGVPLRRQLADRRWRRLLVAAMREGVAALRAAGLDFRLPGGLPPRLLTGVLGLPDPIYARLTRRRRTFDPETRSSMWDDLERGRRTEVELLNGEIVEIARSRALPAPVNAAIVDGVRRLESGQDVDPRELFDLLA